MLRLLERMQISPIRQMDCCGRWIIPWSGWLPITLICLWSVIVYIGFGVLNALSTDMLPDRFHTFLISIAFLTVAGSGFFVISILFLQRSHNISTLDIGLTLQNWRLILTTGMTIGLVKATIVTITTVEFFSEYNMPFGPPGSIYQEPQVLLISLIVGVVVGPACEELVFRGVLYGNLRKKMRIGLAIGINTLIFTVLHDTYPKAASALLTSIIVCSLYEKTGSLLLCIVIHGASNFFTTIGHFAFLTD